METLDITQNGVAWFSTSLSDTVATAGGGQVTVTVDFHNGTLGMLPGTYVGSIEVTGVYGVSDTPEGRSLATAVWTGTDVLVLGGAGYNNYYPDAGGLCAPLLNTWAEMNSTDPEALSGRIRHSAVWTGSEMIISGGNDGTEGVV